MPESRDPATGEVWRRYDATSEAGVREAVSRARAAQPAWDSLGITRRADVLRNFRRLLYHQRLEIATLISRENGKPPGEALAAEVLIVLDFAASLAATAPRLLAPQQRRATTLSMLAKRVTVEHLPHGVVGVIAPWNYPLMLPAGIVLAALVAGNAVVLKPSEFTPGIALRLADILHAAGVPPEILAVVPGDGATGAALVAAGVDKICFTGSVATGKRVAVACAEQLIPCSLELGGSDPALVLDDADIGQAARGIVWGRFSNAGQTCVAPKRVYVADAVYDLFAERVAAEVRALKVGAASTDGSEVGPLVRPAQATALRRQLDHALAGGAKVLASAALPHDAHDGWVAPTLIDGVAPDSLALTEETFGPLLPLVRVQDDDDAVRRANDSDFGLSASVWSRDGERAGRVARRLEAGTVTINDVAVAAGMADVPHGGTKSSGIGRMHGAEGLYEMVRTRTIVDSRVSLGSQPWWFRYGASHMRRFDPLVRLAHGSFTERLRALLALPAALRRR